MSVRFLTCIGILLGFVLGINAQSSFRIEQFSQQDGLPHRWVHFVFQDAQGLLWIGTAGGLVRYDGLNFETIELSPQTSTIITNQSVTHLSEDKYGKFWILKDKAHHNIYDPYKAAYDEWNPEAEFHLPAHDTTIIKERTLFYLPIIKEWINKKGKDSGKAILNDLCTGELLSANAPSITNDPSCIWVWRNNVKSYEYPSDWHHYIQFDRSKKEWIYYDLEEVLSIDMAHPRFPIDHQKRYWYPAAKPVGELFQFFQLPQNVRVEDWENLQVDNHRNIWLVTKKKELYRYDTQKGILQFTLKLTGVNFSVFIDKEEVIWIASESGLIKIVENKKLFENYLDEAFELGSTPPIANSMRNIVEGHNGYIYCHLNNGKIFQINPTLEEVSPLALETFQHQPSIRSRLKNVRFADMEMGRDSLLWAVDGMNGGLYCIDLKQRSVKLYHEKVHYNRIFIISPNQIILYTTDRNLIAFDPRKEEAYKIPHFSEHEVAIYSYFDSIANVFWTQPVASNELLRISFPDGQTTNYKIFKDSTSHIRTWLLEGDSLWLGTTNGLVLFNYTKREILAHYTIQDGLPDNIIYTLTKKDNNIWLGTGEGLCHFNLEDGIFRNFYVEDGLCHNEFNTHSSYLASDGRAWMGGLNGMNAFFPDKINATEAESPNLTWIKASCYNNRLDTLFNSLPKDFVSDGKIILQPSDESFTFYFALSSFTSPEKNHYSWYLEGYEQAWRHSGNTPIANYQNIPAGDYTFKVKAKNYAGNPASNELRLEVFVKQVWYKQWWAWLIYLFGIIGIVGMIARFQLQRKLDKQEAKRLKELDELKSRLYTNITHEFRTPLTVLLGMAEEAEKWYNRRENLKHYKAIELIKSNGQHLLSLINQMLDLSKLEAGKLALNITVVDIVAYLRYIVSSFESYAQQKTINLAFYTSIEQLDVAIDKNKLQNILSNLIANAIKFTPEEGQLIVRFMLENQHLKIEVSDTGIGIAQDKLPYIFNRFYQVDDTHTRQNEGTGIGLTLVKELVKLMNGTIEVKSTEGKGTTFKLLLPLIKETRHKEAISQEQAIYTPPILETTTNPSSITTNTSLPLLLIVEDNEDVIYYIKSCLESSYNILIARNGQEGIDVAIKEIPDIIISDVMMPVKDGYQLVKTLRKEECTSHIPIILLTAKADVISKLEGLKRGADAYLSKPFNREELKIRLEKLIEIRRRLQTKYSRIINEPITANTKQELSTEEVFLQKVQQHIYQEMHNTHFGNDQLAQQLHISQSQLYRKLKALTGKSTAIYIRSVRLQKGRQLLENTELSIAEIAYEVGFADPNYFSRTFAKEFGFPPSKTRK